MAKLTAKQEMFCKEYLIDLNATQAAIRAGYSEKTANVIGPENLAKPCISEIIQKLMNERSKKVEIDSEWVLRGIQTLTDELRLLDDPAKAYRGYELAGKHLKLFTENIDHTSSDGSMATDGLTVEERQARIQALLSKKK